MATHLHVYLDRPARDSGEGWEKVKRSKNGQWAAGGGAGKAAPASKSSGGSAPSSSTAPAKMTAGQKAAATKKANLLKRLQEAAAKKGGKKAGQEGRVSAEGRAMEKDLNQMIQSTSEAIKAKGSGGSHVLGNPKSTAELETSNYIYTDKRPAGAPPGKMLDNDGKRSLREHTVNGKKAYEVVVGNQSTGLIEDRRTAEAAYDFSDKMLAKGDGVWPPAAVAPKASAPSAPSAPKGGGSGSAPAKAVSPTKSLGAVYTYSDMENLGPPTDSWPRPKDAPAGEILDGDEDPNGTSIRAHKVGKKTVYEVLSDGETTGLIEDEEHAWDLYGAV